MNDDFKGCWWCGGPRLEASKRRKYCKFACCKESNKSRFENESGLGPSDRARLGSAAEMLVAADLLKRHKDVLRSLNPHGGFDLAVLIQDRPLKIEVKTGHLCGNTILLSDTGYGAARRLGRQDSATEQHRRFDILAVVLLREGEVVYNPAPSEWGRKECDLKFRARSMHYTPKRCRRVKSYTLTNGILRLEFEEQDRGEQDCIAVEITLKHYPELAEAGKDTSLGPVLLGGYRLRWPSLDFEINVTDFLREEPTPIKGITTGHSAGEANENSAF